jgi:hypothetical protein
VSRTQKKTTKKKAARRQIVKPAAAAKTAAPAMRNKPQMPVYLIRDVDPDVYRKFKARAAAEGRELKFLFDRFIREYADGTPDA